MSEHDLKRKVDRWLKRLAEAGAPIWYLKIHGGIYQRSGVPDYLLCIDSRFVAIELKSPEERAEPTTAQRREMERIERAHGRTACCNRLEDVQGFVFAVMADLGLDTAHYADRLWPGYRGRNA